MWAQMFWLGSCGVYSWPKCLLLEAYQMSGMANNRHTNMQNSQSGMLREVDLDWAQLVLG